MIHDLEEYVLWLMLCTNFCEEYRRTHDLPDHATYMANQIKAMYDEWNQFLSKIWARVDSE